jgi:hypothetical protein
MTTKTTAESIRHFEKCITMVENRIAERDIYIANKQYDISKLAERIRKAEADIESAAELNGWDRDQLPGLLAELNKHRAALQAEHDAQDALAQNA